MADIPRTKMESDKLGFQVFPLKRKNFFRAAYGQDAVTFLLGERHGTQGVPLLNSQWLVGWPIPLTPHGVKPDVVHLCKNGGSVEAAHTNENRLLFPLVAEKKQVGQLWCGTVGVPRTLNSVHWSVYTRFHIFTVKLGALDRQCLLTAKRAASWRHYLFRFGHLIRRADNHGGQ